VASSWFFLSTRTFVSNFRINIQVLDIAKDLYRTPNCSKVVKMLYELSTIHETLKILENLRSKRLGYGLKNSGTVVLFKAGTRYFSHFLIIRRK